MKCEDIQNSMISILRGETDPAELDRINRHLAVCSTCRTELEELRSVWQNLASLPEEAPSTTLRRQFNSRMEQELEKIERPNPTRLLLPRKSRRLLSQFTWHPAWQFAATLLLLGIGFTGGYLYNRPQQKAFSAIQNETDSIRHELSLVKLSQSSARDRLAGVHQCTQISQPDDQIIGRLLDIIDNDENVQVRLAAVDALYLFGDRPGVSQGITTSLKKQDSPLMQVALIDLLVAWREKQAAGSLKALVEDRRIDPLVQERAKESLEKLL